MSADLRLPADRRDSIGEITIWLDEKPSLARVAAAARRFEKLHSREPGLFAERSLLILRNFTVEPIEPFLRVAGYRGGLALDISYSGYDPGASAEISEESGMELDAALILLRLEELAPALVDDFLVLSPDAIAELGTQAVEQVMLLARRVRASSRAAVLVHNFVTPVSPPAGLTDAQDPGGLSNTVRRMNVELAERVRAVDGTYILDADHLLADLGLRHSIDTRGARLADAPLTTDALRTLADSQIRHILALRGPVAKCVIVDCDNTLWAGVVGEDGISGLAMGQTATGVRHRDLQRQLVDLRRRGVVLAIVSKNEPNDVLEVLRCHPDCLLGEDDFAAVRINWQDKAENLISLADELTLSLDHMLFIDDNPVECEWVRRRLPQLRVIQWPEDLHGGRTLDDLGLFDTLQITKEDRARTSMYQAESKRRAAKDGATTVEAYLRSLNMVATIGQPRPHHLPRISQLTLRTNQFNLTTRRHDLASLEALVAAPQREVLWLSLRDRFGDSGMIGCGMLHHLEQTAIIDALLLSCRVIGRGAEEVLVHALAKLAQEMGAQQLLGEYIPSKRNGQVKDFYERLGFEGPEELHETNVWRWDLSRGLPSLPAWLTVCDPDGVLK